MDECVRSITECAVCLNTMVSPQQLVCLHTFCKACIKRLMKARCVACPCCTAISVDADVKDDFKVNQLIDAMTQSKSVKSYASPAQQAEYHVKELEFVRSELQASADAVAATNKKAASAAVAKVRAVKRMWVQAFERRCKAIESNINDKVKADERLAKIKNTLADVTSELKSVSEKAGAVDRAKSPSAKSAARDSALRVAQKIAECKTSFPDDTTSSAVDELKDWDSRKFEYKIDSAVEVLLNPTVGVTFAGDGSLRFRCDPDDAVVIKTEDV